MIGWLGHIAILQGALLNDVVIKANTALALLVGGASLVLYHTPQIPRRRVLGVCCGVVVLLIGGITILEYCTGWNPGFDEWIALDVPRTAGSFIPGRMAFSTAVCFLLIGASLILLHTRWTRAVELMSLTSIMIALLMMLGTFTVTHEEFGFIVSTHMAVLTGIAIILLSLGVMIAKPSGGMTKLFTSDTVGGSMMRLILPGIFLVPMIFGWLSLQGELHGWYDARYALSLLVFSIIAVSLVRVFVAARWLNRIDAQLHAREQMFAAMIEHSTDVVTLTNSDMIITYTSPSVFAVNGYTPEELVGRQRASLIHPDDLGVAKATMESMRTLPGVSRNLRLRQQHKDGTWRWIDATVTNLLGEPDIHAIVSNYRDVTARKAAEDGLAVFQETLEQRIAERTKQLTEANKELEFFSYSVSHDLRAPLSRIHGFAHILQEDFAGILDEEGRRFVNIVATNSDLMVTLMDSLLLFTRLHKQPLILAEIDLQSLVRRAWGTVAPPDSERTIEFTVGELPNIQGDAVMIMQVFTNLLSNAVKFTNGISPAIINVSAEQTPEYVLVRVQDNGAGFRMENAGRLFTLFQRLHSTSEYGGIGVGLAFAQRYMERHGGVITGVGETGKGAVFMVKFPRNAGQG